MKIASAIKTSYPTVKVLQDKPSMDIWYMMLSDLDYRVCQTAVLELISTSKFLGILILPSLKKTEPP